MTVGLLLAMIMWSTPRFALMFRTLFFLPYLLPIVVVGLVWNWIYHPLYGVLNSFLELMGLDSLTRGWLADGDTALYAVLGQPSGVLSDSSPSRCSPAFRVSTRMWSMLPQSTEPTGCNGPGTW